MALLSFKSRSEILEAVALPPPFEPEFCSLDSIAEMHAHYGNPVKEAERKERRQGAPLALCTDALHPEPLFQHTLTRRYR